MNEDFKDWFKMSEAERLEAVKSAPDGLLCARIEYAKKHVKDTAELLKGCQPAFRLCFGLPLGFYLANTPEQMAEYCKENAKY